MLHFNFTHKFCLIMLLSDILRTWSCPIHHSVFFIFILFLFNQLKHFSFKQNQVPEEYAMLCPARVRLIWSQEHEASLSQIHYPQPGRQAPSSVLIFSQVKAIQRGENIQSPVGTCKVLASEYALLSSLGISADLFCS